MTVVFLGTPEWAAPSLRAVVAAGHAVPLVVTQPDKPSGRSGTPIPTPVKRAALDLGLRVEQPAKVRDEGFRSLLSSCSPDVLAVVAYGRILPPPVLAIPRLGPVNVHFSLLPRLRGAAPVQWALARCEDVTGVTTMRMGPGLDEGDVLLQREVAIEPREHAPALGARLSEIGASLLLETLDGLAATRIVPRPQDSALATHAPLLKPEDGEADFTLRARAIEGRVRGFDPWPGVWARRNGKRIRLIDVEAIGTTGVEAPGGSVLRLDGDALLVACAGGTLLRILAVQPEGRRAISARDAVNGRQLVPGDRLEGRIPAR